MVSRGKEIEDHLSNPSQFINYYSKDMEDYDQ